MHSLMLAEARRSFLEALELGGRSKGTLALYQHILQELENWLEANGGPLVVEEVETSHIRGFLLHLSRRPKRAGYQYQSQPKGDCLLKLCGVITEWGVVAVKADRVSDW